MMGAWKVGIVRRLGIGIAVLGVAGAIGWGLIGPDWRAFLGHQPYGRDILFWNLDQGWISSKTAGGPASPLPSR